MPGKVNEQAWNRAKNIIRKQYKNVSEDSDRFWKLVQHVYQNIEKGGKAMKSILFKSRVKAHTRRMKGGKVVQVREHDTSFGTGKEIWQMTVAEREAEKLRLKTKYSEALATPLASEGSVSPYQIGQMGKTARRKFERNAQQRMIIESRLRRLGDPKGEQKIRMRETRKKAEGRILIAVNRINDLTRLGVGSKGKIRPKYQRAIDETKEALKEAVAPYPDLKRKYSTMINPSPKPVQKATKSMENKPMDTLEKYPALMKAVGSVKGHQRRTKSGRMIAVREHVRAKKPGQRGFESPHLRDSTNYFVEMAQHHKGRMQYHSERMEGHKSGSSKYLHHRWRAMKHEADWEMHRDEAGLSTKEERKKNPKKAAAKDAVLVTAAVHKSQESEPMDNIDLTKFPVLAKAIEHGSLSKSLEFVKTGKEIYLAVMAKIGDLQGELLVAVGQWKDGLEPSTSVTDEMPTEATGSVGEEKSSKEPWECRTIRKKIDTLRRIARNIDQSKKFKLSEYELQEYGL